MYSRQSEDQTYSFEPSGGLLNGSLVMQDRETDTYWSIITEQAIHGPAKGEPLRQLPGAVKTTWGEWRARHPQSLVLSVEGREHDPRSPYDRYFASAEGYRKITARDPRLPDKALLFAFQWNDEPHAVPHEELAGGRVFNFGDRQLFLYRGQDDSHYRSTSAFLAMPGASFVRRDHGWIVHRGEERAPWKPETRRFSSPDLVETFGGFDTFWYIWNRTEPGGELLSGD